MRLKVGVLFGSPSTEHEISIKSAISTSRPCLTLSSSSLSSSISLAWNFLLVILPLIGEENLAFFNLFLEF